MGRITNFTFANKIAQGTGKEGLRCARAVGGGYPFCCPCRCPISKPSCGEEEEQPPKVRSGIRWVLSEIQQGAWAGQQLNPSLFCRKGPECCCKSSAELEPTVLCSCRKGECHSMRNNTEMCHHAHAAQVWYDTSRRTWPSSGCGVSGEIWAGWRAQREHWEGSGGAKAKPVSKG